LFPMVNLPSTGLGKPDSQSWTKLGMNFD